MYNVFSITDVQRCGIHPEQIRRALGCCIERLGRGVYVLRRDCKQTNHRQLQYRITHEALVLPPADTDHHDPFNWWERDMADHVGILSAVSLLPDDVISHHSAARLWGLPLLPRSSKRVEVSHPMKRRIGKQIHRHHKPVPQAALATDADFRSAFETASDDVVCPSDLGITMTTLERTVVDICRDCALQEAVMVADAYIGGVLDPPVAPGSAALRRPDPDRRSLVFATSGDLVDFPLDAQERATRKSRLLSVAAENHSARGQRQFRLAMEICQGMSESPAESLAKLGFFELGLEVEQQFRVDDAEGLIGWADFRVKGTNLLFEVDGQGKYRNKATSSQADMDKLMAEKVRTDRMHRRGYHTERGSYQDISKPDRFGPLIWRAIRAARNAEAQPPAA